MKNKTIVIIVALIIIVGVAAYFVWNNIRDRTYEEYGTEVYKINSNAENKTYPYYVNYDININPPKVAIIETMNLYPESENFCSGCLAQVDCVLPGDKGYPKPDGKEYYTDVKTYSELIKRSAIYRIEVNPTYSNFRYCNDFFYIYSLDDKPGKLDNIKAEFNPPESNILDMSYRESLKVTDFYKKIELVATHLSLNDNSNHCIRFVPWPSFHNRYNITVPNAMSKYYVDSKGVCDVSVNNKNKEIIVFSDCKPFKCSQFPPQYSMAVAICEIPKIEICFN